MAEQVIGKVFTIGQPAREAWDDLSLAGMIAQAVRTVSGVCGMSQGRFALAATYGPGEHVPGVVLWRAAPDKLLIEVHIVVCKSLLLAAFQQHQTKAAAQPPIFLQLAEYIRLAAQDVCLGVHLVPHAIDVVIEDIC